MRCFIAHEEKESYASFKYQFGEIVLFIFVDMNSVGNIMTGREMFEERSEKQDTSEDISETSHAGQSQHCDKLVFLKRSMHESVPYVITG